MPSRARATAGPQSPAPIMIALRSRGNDDAELISINLMRGVEVANQEWSSLFKSSENFRDGRFVSRTCSFSSPASAIHLQMRKHMCEVAANNSGVHLHTDRHVNEPLASSSAAKKRCNGVWGDLRFEARVSWPSAPQTVSIERQKCRERKLSNEDFAT